MSDSNAVAPASNRRSSDRYVACTLASLQRPDGEERPALVHDLSESGALLLVRTARIFVNDEVTMRLPVAEPGQKSRLVHGVVVRVEELSASAAGPWLRRAAVRFHEVLEMYPAEIEVFRRRAQRLGIG
jgi:hypothetical protein